jgi:hypothetical protein
MKKTFLLIGLLLMVVCGVFAQVSVAGQTFYYRYIETVDPETGVRSYKNGFYVNSFNLFGYDDRANIQRRSGYITFTRNSCYISDERGLSKGSTYTYRGLQNNIHVFYKSHSSASSSGEYYLFFSNDYRRLNNNVIVQYPYRVSDPERLVIANREWHVYEQASPPQQGGGTRPTVPDTLY